MENQKNVLDLSKYTTEALIADLPANRQFYRDGNGKCFILKQVILSNEIFNEEVLMQKSNESCRDFLCRYLQGAYEFGHKGAFLSNYKKDTHITINIERFVDKVEIHTAEDAGKVAEAVQAILTNALTNVKNHQA